MKKMQSLMLLSILFVNFFLSSAFSQDYNYWSLPKGAKMRLGKSIITGDIVFSPDNAVLAVGSSIGTWLYDAHTGSELKLLTDNSGYVRNVAFSPDSKTVVISTSNKFIVWDVASGEIKLVRSLTMGNVYAVVFSPDGKTIATGGSEQEEGLQLWDAETGTLIKTFAGLKSGVETVAFSPDGKTIAAAGDVDDSIKLWDVDTGYLKSDLRIESDPEINKITFSPDGKTIAGCAGWSDRMVYLWDVASGTLRASLTGHTDSVNYVSFSPDGRTLASGGEDYTVVLWDAETLSYKTTLTTHTNRIEGIAFSPDGKTIASGSRDGKIILWDTQNLEKKLIISGHIYGFQSIAFSPDGKTIASGSYDKTVRLWDTTTGKNTSTLPGHIAVVESVAFSPDGRMIASGGGTSSVNRWSADDFTVKLWDVDSGQNINTLYGHKWSVYHVTFSPDGKYLVSSSGDSRAIFWDAKTGNPQWTITGDGVLQENNYTSGGETVGPIEFSADGRTFVSANRSEIRLWNTESRQTVASFMSPSHRFSNIAFSPDGKTYAAMREDNEMYLLNVATGEIRTFLTGHTSRFTSIAFSPNGETLVTAGDDKVRFWNPENAELKLSVTGMPNETDTIAFSPDGQTLATASWDGTMLLWDVPSVINLALHESDITGDGILSIHDLLLVAANFGRTGTTAIDVNSDEVVDIADLIKIASELEIAAIKPELTYDLDVVPSIAEVKTWINEAKQLDLFDPINQKGVDFLINLLKAITPNRTALLPNYPNPFNPETWIPYQLAQPTDVTIHIYATNGDVIRTLDLGHQTIGLYHHRGSAAYWDGTNELGEAVASGIYFYTFTAGTFTATRKMVIRK